MHLGSKHFMLELMNGVFRMAVREHMRPFIGNCVSDPDLKIAVNGCFGVHGQPHQKGELEILSRCPISAIGCSLKPLMGLYHIKNSV